MSMAPADTVPEPARAPGPRPRLKRRFAKAATVGAVGTIHLFVVVTNVGPMSAAGIGRAAEVPVWRPWFPQFDWLRRRVVDTVPLTRPSLRPRPPGDEVWLSLSEESQRGPSIPARCSCRYSPARAIRHAGS